MVTALLCANCGLAFIQNKRWQIYCSRDCNRAAYYKRKTPRSILDPEPTGPSPLQEAERERRKNLKPPLPKLDLDLERRRELDSIPTLDDLYGPKKEKDHE